MFVRINQQRNKDGSVRQYLQVIEAIRVDGKPRQRVIATIGRWDLPQGRARVDAILEALSQFADKLTVLNLQKDLKGEGGLTWGPVLVFRRLWEELGLARLWGWLWEETKVELVLWDTTTVRFEGRGPEKLAQFGNAKDKRTDRRQMVVGVLLTRDGWPLAHAVYPGNLNDVKATLAIIGQLKRRFAFRKVLFVADRGAVGKRTLKALEQAGFEYIVGMRMRRVRVVRDEVVGCPGRYRVVSPTLQVKEVIRQGRRYILAFNPEAAEHDRQVREEVVARLRQALKEGSPGDLIRHSRYRRYLKVHRQAIELNEAAIEADARYDGKFVVLTNTNRDAAEVSQSYKTLWRVERAFRDLKSSLEIRPVYVWTDEHVRGHVAVCFLAFVLASYLRQKLPETVSYRQALTDLEKLKAVPLQIKGKRYLLRTELEGTAPAVFRILGIRPPNRVEELPPTPAA